MYTLLIFYFKVNNTEALEIEFRGQKINLLSYAFGKGEVTDSNYPNRLYVSFEEFGGCGEHAKKAGGGR